MGGDRFSGIASMPGSKARCDCQIRRHVKEFIRHLRDKDNNYLKSKEKIRRPELKMCAHTLGDDLDDEQNLIMLTAFEHFAKGFENERAKGKVKKTRVFKRFCELMLKEESLIPIF
jgi:hypothetical protein